MNSSIGKSIHKEVLMDHPFFKTSVDDRLKWIPFSTVFFLDLFGVKTRSGWKRQVLLTGATEAIRYMICDSLKKLVPEHRPLPYLKNDSFPSGHTASSFAGAEFMHKELKGSMPVLSCVGYVGATAVAVIRLMEDRHWLKDVVAGAAIGIISAKLAYALLVKRKKKRINEKNDQPIVGPDSVHKTFRALNEVHREE